MTRRQVSHLAGHLVEGGNESKLCAPVGAGDGEECCVILPMFVTIKGNNLYQVMGVFPIGMQL